MNKTVRVLRLVFVSVILMGASIACAQEAPSWRVVTGDAKRVVIQVKTIDLKTNEYLAAARCTIQFLDSTGKLVGERDFDFPVPIDAGKTKVQGFDHDMAKATSAVGKSMHFKIQVYGDAAALHIPKATVGDVPAEKNR